jgi:hypothetical protein
MDKSIDGLLVSRSSEYLIVEVATLSEDLKNAIRNRFATICHGEQLSLLKSGSYTYKNTVLEFLTRIKSKAENTQTGMIGEFLVHVITGLFYPDYRVIIPYFNLEERSIRKGFDSVIYSTGLGVWTYEVKSSKPTDTSKDIDTHIKTLINIAHKDLSGKLKESDEQVRLWGNAMSGMQVACGHLKDEKEILQNIILDYQNHARANTDGPKKYNVILCPVLISGRAPMTISKAAVVAKHNEHKNEYKKLMVLAIHKSTAVGLINFLESEYTA